MTPKESPLPASLGSHNVPYANLTGHLPDLLELPTIGAPALGALLDQGRKKTLRVWAEQSPFDLKDTLKRRGYRGGSDGSWHIDVAETQLDDEIAFLRTEIYLSDVEPRLQVLTALSRFSVRA